MSKKQLESVKKELGEALHLTGSLRASDASVRKSAEMARGLHDISSKDNKSNSSIAVDADKKNSVLASNVSAGNKMDHAVSLVTRQMDPHEFGFGLDFLAPSWSLKLEDARTYYNSDKENGLPKKGEARASSSTASGTNTGSSEYAKEIGREHQPLRQQNTNFDDDDDISSDDLKIMYWLREQCEIGLVTSGGAGGMEVDDMAFFVCQILLNEELDDSSTASELYSMFGDAGFDIIGALIGKRILLVKAIASALSIIHGQSATEKSQRAGNSYGQQVAVMRSSDKCV